MKKVLCAHGFGVRADGRGMFTDIAQANPDVEFITFDFNTVDERGDITVEPLDKQVEILNAKIAENSDATTLLCHSQGCIVASMANTQNIEHIIFLAPPKSMSLQRFVGKFDNRPGSNMDLEGTSTLARSDGTTTYIGQAYIKSIENVDVPALYAKVAKDHRLTIIRASEDNILGKTNFEYLNGVQIIDIAADHDFTSTARPELLTKLKEII